MRSTAILEENEAINNFGRLTKYYPTYDKRESLYQAILDEDDGVKKLQHLLKVIDAKRLVKRFEINEKKLELSCGYPANSEDVDTINAIDAEKAKLDQDGDLKHLEALMREVTHFINQATLVKSSSVGMYSFRK